MKTISKLLLILSLLLVPSLDSLAKSKFDKKRFEFIVRNSLKAPLKIEEFEIKDKGVNQLSLKGVANLFTIKVRNQSRKTILAYKIKMKEYNPFQNLDSFEIVISATQKIKPKGTDKSFQERMVNHHLETLYIVSVDEVLFEDGTVWSVGEGVIKP